MPKQALGLGEETLEASMAVRIVAGVLGCVWTSMRHGVGMSLWFVDGGNYGILVKRR